MEQMYLVEIFVDKVTVFEKEESSTYKNLIIKVKFGPRVQFIIKENQLALNEKPDDIIETDESGRRKWTRVVRVGKSYLFPSYPDTLLLILSKFPLEIEIWNDDGTELDNIYVGVGNMQWDTQFFLMLKETRIPCKIHEPLSIKSKTTLWAECCCSPAGEISFILRLSALGDSIITEFQQLLKDPDSFVFRTNKAPSMFQCKRVDGEDPNFCMVGSIYETTTLEDPDVVEMAQKKIEVCTELQSCGIGHKNAQFVCDHTAEDTGPSKKKKYPIDKIKMGDITGPCGNTNCALAHKVRTYIRNLESYRGKAAPTITDTKGKSTKKICGTCVCKDDRWHRDDCPEDSELKTTVKCAGCAGVAKAGHTCKDKQNKLYDTKADRKSSDTTVAYVFSITKFPDNKKGIFGQDTIVEDCFCTKLNSQVDANKTASLSQHEQVSSAGCSCFKKSATSKSVSRPVESRATMLGEGTNNPMLYNLETNTPRGYNTGTAVSSSVGTNNPVMYNVATTADTRRNKMQVYNCMEIQEEKDCKCSPPKPSPPCKTFDCDCFAETLDITSRKVHRPYCPLYKHKENCPVTMMNEEEELKKLEEDEDETMPLPYGLPPIKLGPCPTLGRPCTVPDGFARMYKNAQLPTQPYSFSDDGKVCCSKEYERIKKAIREYMKYDKDHDFRCINKFNIDTERRCCDKEQVLLTLMGKSCCGSHKMSIQEKYAKDKKQQ